MDVVIDKIKPEKYPAYKDSGAEWLGDIPAHWESTRMKHLFRDVSIKNKPEAELLSVTQSQGVVPRTWVENRMVMPSGALESFKFIHKGDFAISLRSFEGGLEYCHHDGIISPAYTVLKAQKRFDSKFYKYLFKSFSFVSELQTSVVGIRQGKNISYPELSYSFLPIPPLEEQTLISLFLDQKTILIEQAICIKEKQIELLKERRQILVHKVVTRGLNPDVNMKESGVEWIGLIPEHWEVKRLKFITTLIGIKTSSKGSPLRYIGMENIESWTGNYIETSTETEGLASYFAKGDILFGKLRPYLAKVYLAENDGICSTEFLVYRACNYLFNLYLQSLMVSFEFVNLIDSSTYGSKMPRANSEFIGNQLIPIPPKSEQIAISKHIDYLSQKLAAAISLKEKEIEKLKEYKATLINSAVTGKIMVYEKSAPR